MLVGVPPDVGAVPAVLVWSAELAGSEIETAVAAVAGGIDDSVVGAAVDVAVESWLLPFIAVVALAVLFAVGGTGSSFKGISAFISTGLSVGCSVASTSC